MSFTRALFCLTTLAMFGASPASYHGTYRVGNIEIQYDVPIRLIGPPVLTSVTDQFRGPSNLGIFDSSYIERHFFREVPTGGGISLGLSPYPDELQSRHDLAAYTEFYMNNAAKRGLRARVTSETISGLVWMRSEETYKNGNLARVIYAIPILPNYQLVCRVGLSDDLDPETKTRWPEWKPAMAELMQSIRFADTMTGAKPAGVGLTLP